MRNFNEIDKKKKLSRIQLPENPEGLTQEALSQLENMIKASLRDDNLQCATAFKIAKQAKVPKIAVGELTDRLGFRITNCQIGCFKVDKTVRDNVVQKKLVDEITPMLESLKQKDELTCVKVFELALQLKLTPMAIADVANLRNWKIHHCQLGCF
jgi:hypothetical protein